MAFLWRALGVGGSAIPGFEYDLGEVFDTFESCGVVWSVKPATRRDEKKTPATVFEVNVSQPPQTLPCVAELARNALRRSKSLRLPGILRCDDAVEHNNVVYIATEPCVSLRAALSASETYYGEESLLLEGVTLGIHAVASALAVMHKNGLAHNNVNAGSVFVLPSGEWRLFGHELVNPFDDEHSPVRRFGSQLLAEHRRPPELLQSSSTAGGGGGPGGALVHAFDAWGMGCLILETFTMIKVLSGSGSGGVTSLAIPTLSQQDVKTGRVVPRDLQVAYNAMVSANVKSRWTLDRFVADAEMIKSSQYVAMLQQLDELSLKDAVDRDAFYRKLALECASFPLAACRALVLPKLSNALQFGGTSAAALEPLLKIGSRLSADEFSNLVSPAVVTLFASGEHLVRYHLLTTASQYGPHLPASLVCDKIWPHYVTGFSHKSADIRELSVRALVHFAPKLTEKLLTVDAVQYIGQLQQDREGPIRTNATICLGLIARNMPAPQRLKVLLSGLGRMLRDPFAPSRIAAVKSIASCAEYFPEKQLAESVIPALAPMMVDTEKEVRDVVFATIHSLVSRVEGYAQQLPASAAVADSAAGVAAAQQPGGSPAPRADPSTSATPAAAGGGLWSWLGGGGGAAAPKPTGGSAEVPSSTATAASGGSHSNSSHGSVIETSAAVVKAATPKAAATPTPLAQPSTAAATSSGGGGGGWGSMDDDDFDVPPVRIVPLATPAASSSTPAAMGGASIGGAGRIRAAAPPSATAAPSGGGGMKLSAAKKGLGKGD